MKIGVPGGLLYYRYSHFMDTFVDELGAERIGSVKSNKNILNKGIHTCVDEACMPIKIFNGHVRELSGQADAIIVPRIMQCEYGESICPKFCGLPELTERSAGRAKLAFSYPLRINDRRAFVKAMVKGGKEIGFSGAKVEKAIEKAEAAQRSAVKGIHEKSYPYKVFLAGHAYNIYDSFANMDVINKLHALDIGVISEEAVSRAEKYKAFKSLIKNPYWLYFRNNYGAAIHLIKSREIQGIIYLSSFNCGIDSITVDFIKNEVGDFPMLVLKLDEQSGEAGLNTRVSAFKDILEAGTRKVSCK